MRVFCVRAARTFIRLNTQPDAASVKPILRVYPSSLLRRSFTQEAFLYKRNMSTLATKLAEVPDEKSSEDQKNCVEGFTSISNPEILLDEKESSREPTNEAKTGSADHEIKNDPVNSKPSPASQLKDTDGMNRPKPWRLKMKKVALLLGYSGTGYHGMQWQPQADTHTVESVLLGALAKLNLIIPDWNEDLQKLGFQRCARTDKGVSAATQVCSIPLNDISLEIVPKINAELPSSIRVFGWKRTTGGFNSKNWCSGRTYSYMLPTFAFCPLEEVVTADYRIPAERIKKVNELLQNYAGSRNFHNFTSGIKPWQDTAKRYMMNLSCSDPFVQDGLELAVISVKGQSFMMHQIRKMVGLVIAIMRGHLEENIFETVFGPSKVDIPRAPGLGLMLQAVHFDQYNRKFGNDGCHQALEWPEYKEEIDKFTREYIFPDMIKGEKTENSMLNWLADIPNHVFGHRDHEADGKTHSAIGNAMCSVEMHRKALLDDESDAESDSDSNVRKKMKIPDDE